MVKTPIETDLIHSPSSLVGIFANNLNNDTTRRPIAIKGVYSKGKGNAYGGYYYDILKDENSDAYITLVVPASIRASLVPNKTIECIAYASKKVQLIGGRVDLQVNVMELVAQEESKYTDEQVRGFELLQKKGELGNRDVDSLIRSKITKGELVTIVMLFGKNAIIDTDIKHQLQDAIAYYKIHFLKINLSSEREIIEHLNLYSRKCDIIAIARGGGDGLEVFNKPEIIETALTLQTPLLTAIGHEQDVTLLQKVADKAFITPTAFGQYLNDIYNKTIEQIQDTKAKLVEDISKQFKANYEQQIQVLNNQIESLKELNKQAVASTVEVNNKEIALLNNQIKDLSKQNQTKVAEIAGLERKVKSKTSIAFTLALVVIALIVGFLLARAF
jgi:exodeoxyribonuclease VII large subunit